MTVKEKVGRRRYLYVQPFIYYELKNIIEKYQGRIVNYKGQKFIFVKHFNLDKIREEMQSKGIEIVRVSGTLKSLYEKLGFN